MNETDKTNMIEKLKNDISVNFKDGDDSILSGFIDDYISIASDNSNRLESDKKLYPYVYEAVKESYIRRGDEGSSSSSEGSLSTSYIDIVEKLKRDVISIRLFRL